MLVIVVIVCKCLLISSICFSPISPFYACCSSCFPPPSSTAPPLLVCSDAAPSTEAAAHGWYLSLLLLPAQHGILCMPAEYSTARNGDMHGFGNESNVDLLYVSVCLSVRMSHPLSLLPFAREDPPVRHGAPLGVLIRAFAVWFLATLHIHPSCMSPSRVLVAIFDFSPFRVLTDACNPPAIIFHEFKWRPNGCFWFLRNERESLFSTWRRWHCTPPWCASSAHKSQNGDHLHSSRALFCFTIYHESAFSIH